MQTKAIFLDGHMTRARAELIDSLTPGVVQGTGVFETMRVYQGTIVSLEEHFRRMSRGLKRLKIRSPYSEKKWKECLYQTIKINALANARIRLALWKERGVIRIAIVCQQLHGNRRGIRQKSFKAIVSDVPRKKTKFSDIKSIDYACFREAYQHAKKKACDEAVLLNSRGDIVEGSRTNIFYIKRG